MRAKVSCGRKLMQLQDADDTCPSILHEQMKGLTCRTFEDANDAYPSVSQEEVETMKFLTRKTFEDAKDAGKEVDETRCAVPFRSPCVFVNSWSRSCW